MLNRFFFFGGVLAIFLLFGVSVFAQTELLLPQSDVLQSQADRLELVPGKNTLRYIRPKFNLNGADIQADLAEYQQEKQLLLFTGQIIFQSQGVLINAQFAEIDLSQQSVLFKNATFYDENQLIFARVEKIERKDASHYIFTNVDFSQCLPEDLAWQFQTDKLDFYPENMAIARGVSFKVYRTNVFYFPFYVFPTTTSRKTGFLLLSVKYSQQNKASGTGLAINVPYFIAFDPEHDLTLTSHLYTGRGAGLTLDYNYSFVPDQLGQFYGYYVSEFLQKRYADYEFEEAELDDPYPQRYLLRYDHRQSFGNWRLVAGLQGSSDALLGTDYSVSSTADYRRYEIFFDHFSSLNVFHIGLTQTQKYLYSSRYDKTISPHIYNSMPYLYHKFRYVHENPGSFVLSTDVHLNRFALNQDAIVNNSPFDQQVWLSGYRSVLNVTAEYPLSISVSELNVALGLHVRSYQDDYLYPKNASYSQNDTGEQNIESYHYWSKKLLWKTELFRLFDKQTADEQRVVVQPFLEYSERSDTDQRFGLFKPANESFSKTQQDYVLFRQKYDFIDTIALRKSLSLGLKVQSTSQKKFKPKTENWSALVQLDYDFLVNERKNNQTYLAPLVEERFHETNFGDPVLPIKLTFALQPISSIRFELFSRYFAQQNTFYEKNATFRYSENDLNTTTLIYKNNSLDYQNLDGMLFPEIDSLSILRTLPLNSFFVLNFQASYNFLRKQYATSETNYPLPNLLTDFLLSVGYLNCCYKVEFGYTENIIVSNLPEGTREQNERKFFFSIDWLSIKTRRDVKYNG